MLRLFKALAVVGISLTVWLQPAAGATSPMQYTYPPPESGSDVRMQFY